MKKYRTEVPYSIDILNLPETAVGFIATLQEQLEEIPERYRNEAEIEIEPRNNHGDPWAELRITYYRLETDEEEATRLKEEEEKGVRLRLQELELLRTLKKKYYGDDNGN